MEETIENIVDRVGFEKSDLFRKLLNKAIRVSEDSTKSTYAVYDNVIFHMDVLWKGFSPFNNALGKNKKYECGVKVLSIIFDELGVEVEDSDCFILFHIRELGKFIQGGGGGQPFFATAGGKKPDGIDEALKAASNMTKALEHVKKMTKGVEEVKKMTKGVEEVKKMTKGMDQAKKLIKGMENSNLHKKSNKNKK